MASPAMFTADEKRTLLAGGLVTVGNRRYRLCPICFDIVCVNKPLIGAMHCCPLDEGEEYDPDYPEEYSGDYDYYEAHG